MTETTTPAEERPSSSVQPGDLTAKLQACRERAGLDIEQAADEMHLSVSLLRALEKEDFAHLPEPPYVRGYLRGYAKLSDQDAKELIRTYESLRGANPDEIAHHFAPARPLGKVTQPAISPATAKFIGLAVVVLGLGLLSMIPGIRDWFNNTWSNFSAQTAPPQVVRPAPALETFTAKKDAEEAAKQQQTKTAATDGNTPTETTTDTTATNTDTKPAADSEERSPANSTAETTVPPKATPPATEQTATASTEAQAVATAETTTTPTAPVSETTPATISATQSVPPATSTGDTAATTTQATASGTESATTAQNPATATATTTPADPNAASVDGTTPATPVQPIAGEVNVKLEFSEEVWMQVKDESKKTMFESLNSAGSTKEFKATTPLNFKVGNARGVKIYLNGQPFDQAPHTKGSVARFKVE